MYIWGAAKTQSQQGPHRSQDGKSSSNDHLRESTYPYHPWDWYICLHEWLIFMVNVGKYTIHGWYGICFTFFQPSNKQIQIHQSLHKRDLLLNLHYISTVTITELFSLPGDTIHGYTVDMLMLPKSSSSAVVASKCLTLQIQSPGQGWFAGGFWMSRA